MPILDMEPVLADDTRSKHSQPRHGFYFRDRANLREETTTEK